MKVIALSRSGATFIGTTLSIQATWTWIWQAYFLPPLSAQALAPKPWPCSSQTNVHNPKGQTQIGGSLPQARRVQSIYQADKITL